MQGKIAVTLSLLLITATTFAQDVVRMVPAGYDPDRDKLLPDKVFEIGAPLLILFFIVNGIVTVFKMRAENHLKEKALDRQLSEPTLIALFAEDKSGAKYTYLKWFLILAASGLSLVFLYFLSRYSGTRSPYLAMGIVTLFLSVAFLIYYRIISNK